ncbi:uncharacterized protein LOC111057913 [Nilaparvata lugens]|uniref:uncharacterized protein LOC111057913 n=1 Tax=Nilaparvata lugens TaxID=108931 RepID=UPI00193E4D2A|nr:uncharacterized protein LOC111057913 [Nilaparvata lugens]
MIVFRNLAIVLMFIIGNQRLLANAADPEEHAETQTIEETGGGKSATTKVAKMWICQPGSEYLQKQVALTTSLMKGGEKVLQQHLLTTAAVPDETVLLLGKAGSGKTSLVQFLTRNPSLQSIKVRSDTGEYILEDGERIGTSATESFTLYPEIVSYNHQLNQITLCDSPGFHDSRTSAHEIVSMDVMKSIVGRFKKVKILLLEHYGSLQYGGLKDTFMNTLHHLTDFLTDIDRYKDHIALIATKIPFTYKMADEGDSVLGTPELITEEMHIESVMEYLNHTEASIAEKLFTENIGENEKNFYQKVIKLLRSLQTRDENGKARRINVFRRPHKSGPLVNMALLDKNRESLTKTIMHLKAVDVQPNDFDFALSSEAKMYLECLQKLTTDNFKSLINELSYKLNEFLEVKVQNRTSFHQLVADLQSLYDALVDLNLNLHGIINHNEFFEKIKDFITSQKIPLGSFNEGMNAMKKFEGVLSKFSNTHGAPISSSWLPTMRKVIRVVQDELKWYSSLNKFIDGLSSYNIQKNKSEIYSALFHEGMASPDGLMTLFRETTGSTDTKFNTRKRLEIETILETLVRPNNITCENEGALVVHGFHIVLSEIDLDGLVRSYCRKIKLKRVVLFAVDTVFLDENTSDGWRGVNLILAAPRWQVIGQRRIDLSGRPGAEPGTGFPGKPGGNGGSFLGIGMHFLNGGNLRVHLDGGHGGSGATGVNGPPGAAGRNAEDILRSGGYKVADSIYRFDQGVSTADLTYSLRNSGIDRVFILLNTKSKYFTWNVSTEIEVVIKDGECGGAGDAGSPGGAGGFGGFAGDYQLTEVRGPSHIILQNNTGARGEPRP